MFLPLAFPDKGAKKDELKEMLPGLYNYPSTA